MRNDDNIPPWYKQFWPWFLISILVFAVVIGMGLLYVSQIDPDSMVSDDYYKDGRAINEHKGRKDLAKKLGLHAQFSIDEVTGDVSLQLDGKLEPLPPRLQMEIEHPTIKRKDHSVELRSISGNHYTGALTGAIQGRYYIRLFDPAFASKEGWLLSGEAPLVMGQQHQLSAK